jgi:hypothetical protein
MITKIIIGVLLSIIFVLSLLLSFHYGQQIQDEYYSKTMKAQWQGEIKRLEYAFEQTDSCSTDSCLEAWSEILGRDVVAK